MWCRRWLAATGVAGWSYLLAAVGDAAADLRIEGLLEWKRAAAFAQNINLNLNLFYLSELLSYLNYCNLNSNIWNPVFRASRAKVSQLLTKNRLESVWVIKTQSTRKSPSTPDMQMSGVSSTTENA